MRVSIFGSSHSWKRPLGELVLIVIGVLIAFGVNSWWDGRKERGREEAYLQQLLSDMRENAQHIRAEIRNDSIAIASAQRDLEMAFGESDDGRGDAPDFRAGTSLFRPLTGTYTALVQSGDLQLIRNDAVRVELISWATRLVSAQEHLQLYAMRTLEHVERIALSEMTHSRPSERVAPDRLQEAMLNDPQVITAIALERGIHRNRMDLLRELVAPTSRLICLLQAELEPLEAVELDPASVSTGVGETVDFEARVRFSADQVLEGCPVSWISDDEDIAAVEDGKVSGVAEGDAVVTAAFGGASAVARVSVGPERE